MFQCQSLHPTRSQISECYPEYAPQNHSQNLIPFLLLESHAFNNMIHLVLFTPLLTNASKESIHMVQCSRAFHALKNFRLSSFSPVLCTHPQQQQNPCSPHPPFSSFTFNQNKNVPYTYFQDKNYCPGNMLHESRARPSVIDKIYISVVFLQHRGRNSSKISDFNNYASTSQYQLSTLKNFQQLPATVIESFPLCF